MRPQCGIEWNSDSDGDSDALWGAPTWNICRRSVRGVRTSNVCASAMTLATCTTALHRSGPRQAATACAGHAVAPGTNRGPPAATVQGRKGGVSHTRLGAVLEAQLAQHLCGDLRLRSQQLCAACSADHRAPHKKAKSERLGFVARSTARAVRRM